jgi:hypothetical protein
MSAPATSTAAIVSLVFGIIAWVGLPFVGAIVAVIAGHVARADIRNARGSLEGDGFAMAGLVLGWAQLMMAVVGLLMLFLFFGGIAALAILSK